MKLESTEMEELAKYSTRISYSPEDEGYIATVPELPGCSAFGETRAEALTEIIPAIEAWISAAQEAGNPVPLPASLDDDLPSGKFMVRVAKTVHAQLTTAAQREGVSLNQYVGTILATATLGDIYARATTSVTMSAQHAGLPTYNFISPIWSRLASQKVSTVYSNKVVVATIPSVGAGKEAGSQVVFPKSRRGIKVPVHG